MLVGAFIGWVFLATWKANGCHNVDLRLNLSSLVVCAVKAL
jgi:hypothetical protein